MSDILSEALKEPAKSFKGTFSGALLVVGSGWCLWDDLKHVKPPFEVMAVNQSGLHYPDKITHWYSNHDIVRHMVPVRAECGLEGPDYCHSCNKWPGSVFWPLNGGGTSSLMAIYTGLLLGYDRIIMAGIPLDNGGYYYSPVKTNFVREASERLWKRAVQRVFDGRVTSVSGRSSEIVGKTGGN